MKYLNWAILKQIFHRLFASKIVLGAFLGLIAKLVWSILEIDINPVMERIAEVLWSAYILYAAANNPTAPEKF